MPVPAEQRIWATVRSSEDLGAYVARLRYERGLTQEEVATDLGISRRSLYSIESGAPNLFVRRLFEVLNLLGASVTLAAEVDAEQQEP